MRNAEPWHRLIDKNNCCSHEVRRDRKREEGGQEQRGEKRAQGEGREESGPRAIKEGDLKKKARRYEQEEPKMTSKGLESILATTVADKRRSNRGCGGRSETQVPNGGGGKTLLQRTNRTRGRAVFKVHEETKKAPPKKTDDQCPHERGKQKKRNTNNCRKKGDRLIRVKKSLERIQRKGDTIPRGGHVDLRKKLVEQNPCTDSKGTKNVLEQRTHIVFLGGTKKRTGNRAGGGQKGKSSRPFSSL